MPMSPGLARFRMTSGLTPAFAQRGGLFVPLPPEAAPAEMIGGTAIGAAGAPGTIYAGKTLMTGDDFAGPLDIVTPARPQGRYGTTRAYALPTNGNGPRGASGGLVLKMYDVDPAHTGHADLNRGKSVPSWQDAMVQSAGSLKLKVRQASAEEKALFEPTLGVDCIGAMIHSASSLVFRAPFHIEFKATLQSPARMGGFHPSFWLMQMGPPRSANGLEFDWEGESDLQQPNYFVWTNGSSTMSKGAEFPAVYDGQPHTYGLEVKGDQLIWYLDGQIARQVTHALTQPGKPFYFLVTSHITDFDSDRYSAAQVAAAGQAGAVIDLDFVRLWRNTGTPAVRKPAIAAANYEVASGASFSFTLPLAVEVWGALVAEMVEGVIGESNSPGGNYNGGFAGFPAGISYDTVTRVLSGSMATPGTLQIVRYPTDDAAEPHRIALHVGPRLSVANLPSATIGQPYSCDLYALADCGQLTTDAAGACAKTIVVSGLPAGLSYSDATGLITGTATAAGSVSLTVRITNSRGQFVDATPGLTVAAAGSGIAPPVTSGLVGSIDPELVSSLTTETSGSDTLVTSIAGADGTTRTASGSGANRPRLETRNGKRALRFASASSHRMDWSDIAAAQGQSFTRIVIAEVASIAATQCLIETANVASGTTVNRLQQLAVAADTSVRARRASASAFNDASTGSIGNIVGRHVVIEDQFAGSSAQVLRFDRTGPFNAGQTAEPTGATTTTIGARRTGGASPAYDIHLDAWVHRVLVYNRNLSAAEKTQILDWARAQYGTP